MCPAPWRGLGLRLQEFFNLRPLLGRVLVHRGLEPFGLYEILREGLRDGFRNAELGQSLFPLALHQKIPACDDEHVDEILGREVLLLLGGLVGVLALQ